MTETGAAAANTPSGNLLAQADVHLAPGRAPDVPMAQTSIRFSNEGGGQSFTTMPPFFVMKYQIARQGIFSSRQ